jgi:DNA-binding MarR family transcriptional regulator
MAEPDMSEIRDLDEKIKIDVKDLYILERLSASSSSSCVSLSSIAKELGITRQSVHERVKKLCGEGFVENIGRCYVLTEKGRARLRFIKKVEPECAELILRHFNIYGRNLEEFLKNDATRDYALYFIIGSFLAYFLARITWISLMSFSEKGVEKILEELWNKELKEMTKAVIYAATIIEEKGWDALKTFVDALQGITIFNATILEASTKKYSESSRK